MNTHSFTSKLLVSNWNKDGVPRLRVSLRIRDYEFISHNEPVKYLRRMTIKRTTGEIVKTDYPRISKGSRNGQYVPHYITIPAEDVKAHGFQPNEIVAVTVEWEND